MDMNTYLECDECEETFRVAIGAWPEEVNGKTMCSACAARFLVDELWIKVEKLEARLSKLKES